MSDRRPAGLAPRLFAAQALVVLTGAATLVVILFLVAPGQFHTHLGRAMRGGVPSALADHVDRAFEQAVLVSLGAAVAVSLLTTMAVSLFLTRRITAPVRRLADAADQVAAGRYGTRVPTSGLGSEFDRLDAAFNTMSRELATTERRRRTLLSDLAHELRTPVSTLDGFLEGLEDGVIPADDDTWRTLREQTTRLRRLVEDVREVSQAEERRLAVAADPVDLVALATDALRAAGPAFQEKGVRLELDAADAEAGVEGDPDRLREVLDNLLANALRHTQAGGRVAVAIRSDRSAAVVEVVDDGEGIEPADLPHVFDRFFRSDAARFHDTGGSGIGLTIARALVQAHGGTVTAHSEGRGTGARFTVVLPRRRR